VHAEDESVAPAVRSLVVTTDQPHEPVARMRYDILGSSPYAVLEEGDRLAAGLARPEAVATIADRCRSRLHDHLSLGGWMAARAAIMRTGGRRLLVLGDEPGALAARLHADGHEVEGDELVFFRAGQAVCLPGPRSRRVELGPIDGVALGGYPRPGPSGRVTTGEVMQALLAAIVSTASPPRDLVAECVALVGQADGLLLPHLLT
jgi:hypothetical protein